nr:magnesium transporter [Candidatus Sigynarchaeum springense]MDO8118531.1 magnesium transporter [Candidatus Sigynarchaeota archaeon]
MRYFKKIVKESIGVLLMCTVITMFSGMALSSADEMLAAIPFLILILPAQNDVIGDMCQVLVGRMTSHLYIGLVPARLSFTPRVKTDFLALFTSLALSIGAMLVINVFLALASGIAFGNFFLVLFVVICTAFSLFVIMAFMLYLGAIYIFRHNKDPNNFLIPITTSLIDTLSPVLTIVFMLLLL